MLRPRSVTGACAGLITVQNKMALIAAASLGAGNGADNVLVIGRFLDEPPLLGRIGELNRGFSLHVMPRPRRPGQKLTNLEPRARIPTVLGSPRNYASGGAWHVGRDVFETLVTLQDLHGETVGSLSIALPGSMMVVANTLLDKLLWVVCGTGVPIIFLILYGFSRAILAPIRCLTEDVVALARQRPEATRLNWDRQDEFGQLARTMDALLDELDRDAREMRALTEENLALLAAVPDVFCVFGADGVLQSMHCGNLSNRRLTDRLKVGESIASAKVSKETSAAFASAIEQGLKDGASTTLVFPAAFGAEELHVECRIVRLDNTRVLAVFRDMTEAHSVRRQVAEMEGKLIHLQRHESLGHLIGGITHDFNNLLSVIRVSLSNHQRAVEPFLSDYEDLIAISQASQHSAELIRQLQMYAGVSDMHFEVVNLNTLLANSWPLLRASVPHHITLDVENAAHLPYIVADSTQMVQVVSNLLINASEAIGDNPGTIRLTTRLVRGDALRGEDHTSTKALQAEWYVALTVTDNGKGIAPSQVNRILEPFFSTKGEGRGLGLATVAGILDSHEGALSVSSQLGKGTSFNIFLPASIAEQLPAKPLEEGEGRSEVPENPDGKLCVLLVDDDPRILAVIRILIESLDCDVLEAEQEREARLLMQKNLGRIDLLILDANIRGMDGVRALRMIRLKAPNLPTYLISGHDESMIRKAFEGIPFDGFIPKPFTREMFASVLEKVRAAKRVRGSSDEA